MIRFSKYLAMLIFLVKVIILGYNILSPYKQKEKSKKNFIIILPLRKCVTTLNFFKPNIIILRTKFSNKLTWLQTKTTSPLNIFLLNMNFDKFTIRLHFFLYPPYLLNFMMIKDQQLMSSIKYLNFKFFQSKIIHKE